MLKKGIIRRITISSLALFILLVTYFFPTKLESQDYKQILNYIDTQKGVVYLLNKESYVARVNMVLNDKETLEKIKDIISILTLNSKESAYIPDRFFGVIPANTKINNLSLENKLLKIDFSKEFLNTTEKNERKMIESLIYSLTELEEVDNILIFVEGKGFTELPFSKEKLPSLLNKDFGVNKIYDIDSIKNTSKTTIYYGSKEEDYFYYVPVTYVSNNPNEKVDIIIEKLKSSPIYESKLISFLHANAELTNYEILEEEIKLSFNNYIFEDIHNETILEEVKYMIYLSLRDTYHIKQVEFIVNNEDKNVNLIINTLE
ncbi:MAG: GerMN domain-containing protein [Bacilli bacterium]|nr:GerMN domain-containing protein [Bacilli bacterium]